MKRISDNILTMLLPLTVVAATAFSLVAAVAFRMGATTAGFVFATLSIVGWIGLVAEFFLLYDIIIDKWLSKDRSVLTASWFVISLLLAFILTPDKHTDWSTCIIMVSLFAVVFLLPCTIGMAYGKQIKSWLLQRWNRLVPKKRQYTDEAEEKQIEALLSASTPPSIMKQEDEIRHYDSLVSKVQPELIRKLPETLQTNDALFLLVLFREDGYLDTDFRPLMKRRMTKSIRHSTPISPAPFAPPSKSGKANGSSSRSSGHSTTAHSWQATSRPPTGTTRPNTSGISPNCCARRPAFVRSSTPTTLKSSRRSDLHYPFPCSRHRNPMAGFFYARP